MIYTIHLNLELFVASYSVQWDLKDVIFTKYSTNGHRLIGNFEIRN